MIEIRLNQINYGFGREHNGTKILGIEDPQSGIRVTIPFGTDEDFEKFLSYATQSKIEVADPTAPILLRPDLDGKAGA